MSFLIRINKTQERKKNTNLRLKYGFGIATEKVIYNKLGLNILYLKRNPIFKSKLLNLFEKNLHKNNIRLKRLKNSSIRNNIKKFVESKTFKGIRHKNRLPVRGQRNRTNAKTQRRINRKF